MKFLSAVKQKEKTIAIFDIGSSSVGGAIAKVYNNELTNPIIINSTRTEMVFHEKLDFQTFIDDMVRALFETAQFLYNSKVGIPSELFCIISSPWYISEPRTIKIEQKESFIFNKNYADTLIKKEISFLIDLYNKKFSKTESVPELIENHITSVYLNGYSTDNPLNKKTKKVEMNMILSLSPKIFLDKIEDKLKKIFHHKPIKFFTFNNLAYIGISHKYPDTKSYIFIDVGGEITDLSVISDGCVNYSISFPFGHRTFYRFLSEKLNKDLGEVKSIFNLYSSGNLEEKQAKKLEIALDSIGRSWGEAFKQSILSLPRKTFILPQNIFLITNPEITKWFSEVITREDYIKSMIVERDCNVVSLGVSNFNNLCNVKNSYPDPFLMIQTFSIQKKLNLLKDIKI